MSYIIFYYVGNLRVYVRPKHAPNSTAFAERFATVEVAQTAINDRGLAECRPEIREWVDVSPNISS